MTVFDASAVLAYLRDEPGADIVERLMGQARIGAANYAEVLRVAERLGGDPAQTHAGLIEAGLRIEPVTTDDARRAARLASPLPRRDQVSLADCLCLALAERLSAELITGDGGWDRVQHSAILRAIR